jgi:hypothetical protein
MDLGLLISKGQNEGISPKTANIANRMIETNRNRDEMRSGQKNASEE